MLKDEADVDPNDQASVLEHLDKIVRAHIHSVFRSSQVSYEELKNSLLAIFLNLLVFIDKCKRFFLGLSH